MNEINWTPATIFAYRGKVVFDKNESGVILTTNGIGQWVAYFDIDGEDAVREFDSVIEACAFANQVGLHEGVI